MDIDLPKEQSQKKAVKGSSRSKSAATKLHKIEHKKLKRGQEKHRLVLQERRLPDGLKVSYISKGETLQTGYTEGGGIFCYCCNKVVSPTMFESHAGRTSCRKPYQHIFLSNGMSLHQYASSLKLNRGKMVQSNDLLCMVCQKSGELLFCDGCPRSFHKECIPESSDTIKSSDTIITLKKQFCQQCQISMKSTVSKANAVKDGRVSGVANASSLKRNCEKMVQSNDLLCMVCLKSGELLFCEGCPRSFHKECIPESSDTMKSSDTIITLKKRFCQQCQISMKSMVSKANAVKDGRVSRVANASSLKLNCEKMVQSNDLLCMVCLKSGELLFFRRIFKLIVHSFGHTECIPESSDTIKSSDAIITLKKRFCQQCQTSMKSMVLKANAVKDGRVSRADTIEEIAKQCLQLIDNQCDPVACVLCRSCAFSEDGFSDQMSIVCDQCEKEYHIGCLREYMNIDLQELPPGNWFCTKDCENLHSLVKLMVSYGPLMVKDSYMQVVKMKSKGSDADSLKNIDVRWFVLNGEDVCEQYRFLLADAVDIFHDCFNPIIDSVTRKDFISSMAYGEQMGSSNFSGVYSALLTVNLKVVTAGMFRALGREVVELPIVATSRPNQGKGYLQVFFICFERLLSFLRVKKLVVPAADDTKAMWIRKFGFSKLNLETLIEYRQTHTAMVEFPGTTLLQRNISPGYELGDPDFQHFRLEHLDLI
ncbi:hypothetical protein SSX86_000994 [Deinandra increscens subsp. villosa]|uniref:PHD-type domain-containing protein n=1 Tax=Deinandra increscens subsp. villosa TaxID=3103831 RepID=A0AAP0DU62_9ASTR